MGEDNRLLLQMSHSQVTDASESQIYHCPIKNCPHLIYLPDDGILVAWLDAKTGKTQSWKTHVAYHSTALSLRTMLRERGYDLLMDLSDDTTLAGYLLIVQQWAARRAPTSKHKGEIAASTYNHRLAAISSLFEYARQHRLYKGANPIDLVERRTVYAYAGAQAIEMLEMRKLLAKIDRITNAGKRDYALIGVALQTAQRGGALATMRVGDLTWVGNRLKVHFPRTKGAKTDDKLLEVETTGALVEYLQHLYGPDWSEQKQRPVWVSYSNNNSRGEQLSIQAVEQICARHLGTSKSHVTRHTTALALDQLGVPLGQIQELLDHENPATTGLYTRRLKKSQNLHGRALEQVFGVSATRPEEEEA
ncbi:MAG TPA: site-specific integrase [Ktedonobacteraceae bacterium]|nr:site-specific integrase [Ktedonobacteraceae bacterium]